MEITITQKYIKSTPRKVRLVADMIRSLKPTASLTVLKFTSKSAAKELESAVKSALAAANLKGLSLEESYFKKLEINEGPKLRRFRPGTRGRVKPYQKRMSHIKIVLSDEKGGKFETRNTKHETNSNVQK